MGTGLQDRWSAKHTRRLAAGWGPGAVLQARECMPMQTENAATNPLSPKANMSEDCIGYSPCQGAKWSCNLVVWKAV